jgi:glycosyltransferase involved in cell wall biosynthesis
VSVLIPAHNSEKWIARTLHSVIAQSWQPLEIIVVDDGSRDRTANMVRRFDSVGLITQKNQGAPAARNRAYAASRRDFIQWLDADDILAPDKIECQMMRATDDATLLSSAWARFNWRTAGASFIPTALWQDLSPREYMLRQAELNVWMPNCAWLVSLELSEAAGIWDTSMCVDDDGEYFSRVILKSNKIRFVPEAKSFYRYSGSGSVSYIGLSDAKMDAQWRSLEIYISRLLALGNDSRTRHACVNLMGTWLPQFFPSRVDLVNRAVLAADELGERLELPSLPRKYDWIRALFGWKLAKRVQLLLPRARWSVCNLWDRILNALASND